MIKRSPTTKRSRRNGRRLDLAVIIPELAKYGGAERFLIECVSRWQSKHDITIYASRINTELLREHGVTKRVNLGRISPYFEGQHSILLNTVLLPKIWEQEVGQHEMYHTHLWPTHLIDRHPMVWYPHEPLRILHDLRYEQPLDDIAEARQRTLHIYPKYNYDRVTTCTYEAYLSSMDMVDKLGKPDRIVANSRYTAGYIEGVYGTSVPDVVYPGVSADEFIFQPSEENLFLTVGQLWPHKRIKLVIEAMKHVDNAQLYVVGHGPEREKLERMAVSMGLDNRVFLLNGLSNLELKILFSRALGVVFMPVKEPFGIVALEAMAAGKPLIAANEGGFTEVVNDQCALLVAPEPEALAEKMCFLRDNKDVARRMGEAGRELVKNYTWDRAASELLTIIERTHADWARQHVTPRRAPRTQRTLFGTQYYCWYGNGIGSRHWNDSFTAGAVVDMPRIGYYASSSLSTIESHARMMDEAGIDFAIINVHVDSNGVDFYEMAAAETIFRVVDKLDTKVKWTVQLCPYDCQRSQLAEAVDRIRTVFVPSPAYLHYDGEPVLFMFWTGVQDGNKHWVSFLEETTEGFLRIASSLRLYSAKEEQRKSFGLFHGWSLYSPLELSSPANWHRVWTQAYQSSAAGSRELRIATVSPGYDDRQLRDVNRKSNPFRNVDRMDGSTYQKMINFALSLQERPHMVLISTFNEYHENTHIEPSRSNGHRYLELTKQFIETGNKQWNQ